MACSLEINNYRQFYPGEVIEGNLICMFDSVENIVGITCKINGIENTHFILDDQKYKGHYEFFTDECRISEACVASIGARKYPFSFRLPNSGIPSSFTHNKGRVFYKIVGVISRENGRHYKTWQEIKVVVVMNFNDISNEITMTPMTYSLENNAVGCCFCSNEPIFMDMTLEKDAFLIGEKIKVKLDVRNAGKWDMEQITITLQSILQFTSNNPQSKTSTFTKHIVKDEFIGPPKSSKKIYTVDIQIPPNLKFAYLKCCKLIKGWFEIKADAYINEWYSKVDLSMPVQIGHVAPGDTRPIGLPQPQGIQSSISMVPVAQAPILEPSDPSYVSDIYRVVPSLPMVNLPASYQAPRAEEETPMLLHQGDSPSSLPTYDDVMKSMK